MTAFYDIMAFWASTVCSFLMSEPIIYFTGGFLTLIVVQVVRSLCGLNK